MLSRLRFGLIQAIPLHLHKPEQREFLNTFNRWPYQPTEFPAADSVTLPALDALAAMPRDALNRSRTGVRMVGVGKDLRNGELVGFYQGNSDYDERSVMALLLQRLKRPIFGDLLLKNLRQYEATKPEVQSIITDCFEALQETPQLAESDQKALQTAMPKMKNPFLFASIYFPVNQNVTGRINVSGETPPGIRPIGLSEDPNDYLSDVFEQLGSSPPTRSLRRLSLRWPRQLQSQD